MTKFKNIFSKKLEGTQNDLVDDTESGMTTEQDEDFLTDPKLRPEAENASGEQEWLDDSLEGQLSIDVFQDKDNVIIKSTIAGVKPEDIDIAINNDLVTVKGKRENEKTIKQDDYFYQECYWGNFSRSIILPVEVKAENANAELKNGILTITLPKAKPNKAISVKVKSD